MAGINGGAEHGLSRGFVVDHIVHGETALDVLERCHHTVRPRLPPACMQAIETPGDAQCKQAHVRSRGVHAH